HHLRHWADGGETKLENLSLLCRLHHRLVHEEGWRVERGEGGELRFYRPDGRLMPRVPAPPELGAEIEEAPGAALARNQRGLGIDAWTPTTRWEGEHMDLDWALFTLYTPRGQDSSPEGSSSPSLEGSTNPSLDSGSDLSLEAGVSAEPPASPPP
ncbi:MAG: HNH endonuclease signature motif containing protein, partial [Gemmatimonadota bacterium]